MKKKMIQATIIHTHTHTQKLKTLATSRSQLQARIRSKFIPETTIFATKETENRLSHVLKLDSNYS